MDNAIRLIKQINEIYMTKLRNHSDKHKAISYLKGRGITGEMAAKFQIGFAPDAWDTITQCLDTQQLNDVSELGLIVAKKDNRGFYDMFRDRIMFPIREIDGSVVGFGGRAFSDEPPKYLNSAQSSAFNKTEQLYGLYETLKANKKPPNIVVVEGYIDVVAMHQHKLTFGVACMGTSLTQNHVEKLKNHTAGIICCYDGDKAGLKAAKKTAVMALSATDDDFIRLAILSDGHDPDSYINTFGVDDFQAQLAKAVTPEKLLIDEICAIDQSTSNRLVVQLKALQTLLEHCDEQERKKATLIHCFCEQTGVDSSLVSSTLLENDAHIPKQTQVDEQPSSDVNERHTHNQYSI